MCAKDLLCKKYHTPLAPSLNEIWLLFSSKSLDSYHLVWPEAVIASASVAMHSMGSFLVAVIVVG